MTNFTLNSIETRKDSYYLGETVFLDLNWSYLGGSFPPNVFAAAGFLGQSSDFNTVSVPFLDWSDTEVLGISTSALGGGGTYQIAGSIDFGNEFAETNESDNQDLISVEVFDAVQLSLSEFTFDTPLYAGETFEYSLTLQNELHQYGQDLNNYEIDFVMSSNGTYTTEFDLVLDTLQLADFSYDGVGGYQYTGQATLPGQSFDADWFFGLIFDDDARYYEEVENITTGVDGGSPTTVFVPERDIQIDAMQVRNASNSPIVAAEDGETVRIQLDFSNAGNDPVLSDFDVTFELLVVGIPVEIETVTFAEEINVGLTRIGIFDVELSQGPTALAPGDYTLRATADSGDAISETDEGNNSSEISFTILPPSNSGPATGGSSDFDANGADDILFFNDSTNTVGQFQMPDGDWRGVGTAGTGWEAVGTGLFDSDDNSTDILWFNASTGAVGRYDMDGGSNAGWNGITRAGSGWEAVGAGDFNADGIDDILWFNAATGKVGQHQVSDSGASWMGVGSTGSGWNVAAVDDLNADGVADILWHNASTGGLGQFRMAADGSKTWISMGAMGSGFEVVGTGDFWNTGFTNSPTSDHNDILVFNETTGALGHFDIFTQAGVEQRGWVAMGTGGDGWSVEGTGDFDADGVSDILWRKDDGRMGIYNVDDYNDWAWQELNPAGTEWDVII